jgi:hypothetical protein
MMVYFYKELPKLIYGPEVMHYPTFCGINDWGEVIFEDDDTPPQLTDYVDTDTAPATVHAHAHVEHGIHNPWKGLIALEGDDE